MKIKEREQLSHAEQNAEGWSDQITAAWEAYGFCLEEGEGKYLSREAKAVLKEHGFDGTNHDTVAEWIADAMREAPLSVDIREGWKSPGEGASLEPTEFQILLSTGGPALRVMGELNHGEPSRCWLEHQDWGTPWTRYFSRSAERASALLWFASLFYYGEG
jgi:hypothetical protein